MNDQISQDVHTRLWYLAYNRILSTIDGIYKDIRV